MTDASRLMEVQGSRTHRKQTKLAEPAGAMTLRYGHRGDDAGSRAGRRVTDYARGFLRYAAIHVPVLHEAPDVRDAPGVAPAVVSILPRSIAADASLTPPPNLRSCTPDAK